MSLETASTEYIETQRGRFAYRRLGPRTGVPIVLLQHFTGTMDAWDPSVVNALAQDRPVIVFNNLGIGTSTGTTPDTVEMMAADAASFLGAIMSGPADLLGFSLGGMITQVLATRHPRSIRKIIIANAASRGGEEHLLEVVEDAFRQHAADVRLPLFFTASEGSQKAGRAFISRVTARTKDRDPDTGESVSGPQAKAIIGWCERSDEDNATLRSITQPALIVHGSDDTMFPSINAYNMFKAMNNAQLIIYPDSGHGALFQYPETFVAHCRTFLGD